MFGLVEVFRGVFVFGGITAADMAAFQAETKVNPGIAGFQAFLATLRGVGLDVMNVIEMGTGLHFSILQLFIEDGSLLKAGGCFEGLLV